MRQLTNTVTIVTLLLVAAAFALGTDAAAASQHKLSVNKQQSHSAKRVMAKLNNAAAAKSILQARATRFGQPDMEMLHPAGERRERRQSSAAATQRRGMAEQQAVKNKTTVGINDGVTQFWDAPHCGPASKFRVLETRFHDICSRVDFSFVRRHWNDAGRANQAYDRFCTSECAGSINDLLQFTDGYSCFDSDTLTELRLFSAMCQLSTSTPPQGAASLRCGAEVAVSGVFDTPDVQCHDFRHKLICEDARDACQWDNENKMCNERITRAKLEAECSTCYQGIVDVLSDELNPLCAKYQGEFCLPKMFEMQRLVSDNSDSEGLPATGYPASVISQICADPVMLPCFQQQSVGVDNLLLREARSTYRKCIEDGLDTQQNCQAAFEIEHQGVVESQRMFDTICARASANGAWCMAVTLDTDRNNGCPAQNSNAASCNATCGADTAAFLTEAGCCAAFVAQGAPATAATDFPVFENAPAVASASLQAGRGAFLQSWDVAKLEQCAANGAKLYDWANDASCANPAALSAKWTVTTVLALPALNADANRKDAVEFALKLDLGKAAGVPINRLVLTLEAVTLPNGEAGTNVSVQIRAPPATADRALAQLRAALATGHLRMENVDKAIRTCKECKPLTAASAVPRVFDRIPGAPTDFCNTPDFIEPFQALITACSATEVDSLFSFLTADIAAADAAWTAACNSQCLDKFREVRGGDYSVCIPRDILTLGDLMNVGCKKDNNDRRCGAVLTIMTGNDCSVLQEGQCRAAGQCRWNNKTSQCRDQFSEAFLQDVCNGGCITSLAATVGFNNDGFAKEAKLLDTMFCSKDGDTMCLPHIQGTINDLEEKGLTASAVTGVCEERSKLRCMKRIFAAVAADEIFNAEVEFYHCVEAVLDDDRVSHDAKQSTIESLCIEGGIAATISGVDQIEDQLNHMCVRNPRGDYCLALGDSLVANSTCLANMLTDNYCPSDCVAEIESAIERMGCCTGNLQEVNGFIPFANLDEQDVPEFELFEDYGSDFGGPAPAQQQPAAQNNMQMQTGGSGPGNRVGYVTRPSGFQAGQGEDEVQMPKWYYLANFQTCGSSNRNVGDLVYRKCSKARGAKKESRDLDLGISWETISASPKKQKRLEKKLRQDLSIKIGLSSDDFPSLGMKQNPNGKTVQVQGKQPTQSGQRRQTTTDSASTSSFDMNTDTDSDTEAAAASYDQHVADGTLTLSSTLATVANECSNCTSSDVSSANTVATSVTVDSTVNTPAPTTGAAAVSGLAAVLAAVILALLH